MKVLFYKNWKKIALVLTSFFWASCGDDSGSSDVLYGCPPDVCDLENPNLSSSNEIPTSSSAEKTSTDSSTIENSSSSSENFQKTSSSIIEEKSVDNEDKIACTDTTLYRFKSAYSCIDGICPEYGVVEEPYKQIKCEDGTKYELEENCEIIDSKTSLDEAQAEYGVIEPCSNGYVSSDGLRYTEEEFKKIYEINKIAQESSSSIEKNIEPKSSSSIDVLAPLYGVNPAIKNDN